MFETSVKLGGIERKLRLTNQLAYNVELELSSKFKQPVNFAWILKNVGNTVVAVECIYQLLQATVKKLSRDEVAGWLTGITVEERTEILARVCDVLCMAYTGLTVEELTARQDEPDTEGDHAPLAGQSATL